MRMTSAPVSDRASTTTPSDTTDAGTTSTSSADLRGKDYDTQSAMLAPASAGPPNIKFAYSEATLARMAAGDPVAAAVYERFRQFQMSDTKDGVTLTDEQKAVLTVQVLREQGVSINDQKIFMTRVFFGHAPTSHVGVDSIYTLELTGGGLTIRFSSDRGSVEPLVFGAPPVYQGKDDNLRGTRVAAAKNGMYDPASGRQMAIEKDSFIFAEAERIEQHFLMTAGATFAELSPSDRAASPAYKKAFADYKEVLAGEHVGKIVAKLSGRVQAYAADNPTATVAEVVQQVIGMTLNMKDIDFFRYPHPEMRVEDEAIIELLLTQIGIEGSVSSDDFTDLSRLVDKRAQKAPATEADKVATGPVEDPTAVGLPRDNALVRYLDGIADRSAAFHVGPDSPFYAALGAQWQPEWNGRGLGASPCVAPSTGIIPTTHLTYFLPLAKALRVWVDADLNKGDVAAAQAAFDKAAAAFMAAPPAKGGVTIGG